MGFSITDNYIVQSGTDTSLAGLAGLSNSFGSVSVTQKNDGRNQYHVNNLRLLINGTLSFNPEQEYLYFSDSGNLSARFHIEEGGELTIGSFVSPEDDEEIQRRRQFTGIVYQTELDGTRFYAFSNSHFSVNGYTIEKPQFYSFYVGSSVNLVGANFVSKEKNSTTKQNNFGGVISSTGTIHKLKQSGGYFGGPNVSEVVKDVEVLFAQDGIRSALENEVIENVSTYGCYRDVGFTSANRKLALINPEKGSDLIIGGYGNSTSTTISGHVLLHRYVSIKLKDVMTGEYIEPAKPIVIPKSEKVFDVSTEYAALAITVDRENRQEVVVQSDPLNTFTDQTPEGVYLKLYALGWYINNFAAFETFTTQAIGDSDEIQIATYGYLPYELDVDYKGTGVKQLEIPLMPVFVSMEETEAEALTVVSSAIEMFHAIHIAFLNLALARQLNESQSNEIDDIHIVYDEPLDNSRHPTYNSATKTIDVKNFEVALRQNQAEVVVIDWELELITVNCTNTFEGIILSPTIDAAPEIDYSGVADVLENAVLTQIAALDTKLEEVKTASKLARDHARAANMQTQQQ